MKFLFPTFLFALFTIAIPVIIHLFSFKRHKTVYFSNVDFLKNIKKESRKQSRLKQLLILAARILTILFLVFAFAQPYIPNQNETRKQSNQLVAIYIDNSFSMNALSEQGQLLEVARNKALEICMAYPTGTKFRLFTNDLKAKHRHLLNREQFIREVSQVQSSPTLVPLSLIYNRFSGEQLETATDADKNLYVISDFQRSVSDFDQFHKASIFSYYLPLVPNEVANLYIDSCWVEEPAHRLGKEENVLVRIKNSSNQNYQNLPLKLYLNDSLKSITSFSVEPENEIIASLKYTNNTSGLQLGRIEITDYPFTYDNNWYISYKVEPNLNALAVYNNSSSSKEGLAYVTALFSDDDYVLLDEMNEQSLQVNRLSDYNTIFLLNLKNFSSGFLNELENVAKTGTSVALFPTFDAEPMLLNNFLSRFGASHFSKIDSTTQQISRIEFESSFYREVFKKQEQNPILPAIDGHLRFEASTRSDEQNLLSFQNGDKALSVLDVENGKAWIFSFPLDQRNDAFARDILFVPTLYNIVLNSLPKQQISFTVGKNTFYNIPRNLNVNLNSTFEIENRKTGDRIVPTTNVSGSFTRIEFGDLIGSDGHYLIENEGVPIASMAFNFDRKESDLRYLSAAEIRDRLDGTVNNATLVEEVQKNFSEILQDLQNGKQLWKWCILLALFFVLTEVALARFMK